MYILVGVEVYYRCKKGELDRFFDRLRCILVERKEDLTGFVDRLDRPVEESRLDR